MSARAWFHRTLGRKTKPPKEPKQDDFNTDANMPDDRFLECFYSKGLLSIDNTRFFDHFGIENIPFGIASSSSRAPTVAVRHNDLVFFLDGLAEEGYLPAIKKSDVLRQALQQVSSIVKNEALR
jgi:hypothetical protein